MQEPARSCYCNCKKQDNNGQYYDYHLGNPLFHLDTKELKRINNE